ncbi:response regulator [Balneola vulgaris]|jgi:DNA-binding NarL/FixJ family response regulator|uniref:response regulator n=1 Tax=Balneola vulgaris TaxID=287535 RepID=UPI000370FA0A|nr:response regulator [Balneola vulgaris]
MLSLDNKTLLIAEDNMVFSIILERLVAQTGIETIGVCITEEHVVNEALTHRPDFIIMDILLADGNGIEAAKKIRKEYEPTIIFITGGKFSEYIQLHLEREEHVLSKPFSVEDVNIEFAKALGLIPVPQLQSYSKN